MANDSPSIRNATVSRPTANEVANRAASTVDTSTIKEGLKSGIGMNGASPDPTVNTLQQALNEQTGAGLKVDGRFGPKTEAAVRAFQEKNGLEQTGVCDTATVAKLQGKEAPAAAEPAAAEPAAEPTTAQPAKQPASQADVNQSRSKMKSREELMRARVAAAEKAESEGEDYDTITDKSVQGALEGVQNAKGSLDEQKRAVSQTRLGVQNDIRALAAKKNRTEPEEMLLTGKRQVDEVLGQLEKHIDTKKQILDAAGEAVSDGVITDKENKGIGTASEITQRMEQALATKARAADAVVAAAERFGAVVPGKADTTGAAKPVPTTSERTANAANTANTANDEVTAPAKGQPKRGLANNPVKNAPVSNQPANVANETAPKKIDENFAQLSPAQVDAAVNKVAEGVGPKKGIAKDAQKVLSAFDGMSPNQVKQVEDAYNKKFGAQGWDFKKDAVGSLYPHNQKALAALSDTTKTQAERSAEFTKLGAEGAKIDKQLKTDADAIRESVRGMGTDEQKLFDTLGKYADNKEQRDLLAKEYSRQYPGRDLRADVMDDVSGDEAVRAKALMDGNRPLANAGYAHEKLNDIKELTRHLNSIPAADRKAFADAFKKEYGASLSSTVDANTRNRRFANADLAKLLDAVKTFGAN